jgi:acyl-CoA thioester hydrolase
MQVKIYYHHTDCGGVVYYANYLKFLEEARTEFLAERGVLVRELAQKGILFVVARQEIDYKLPAFYGDILDIDTQIVEVGRVRVEFDYEIRNQNNQSVSKAKTILVFVDKDLKPKIIPEEIRKLLSQPPRD